MKIIFAVKDAATETFGPAFMVDHENQAKRTFAQEINREGSQMNYQPSDFELYKLGMYNEETGEVQGMEKARVARGVEVAEK